MMQPCVACVLALALAALPVVLDRCAQSCEAHRISVASAPACHHVVSGGAHLSQAPVPCGHDHNATALSAARNADLGGRRIDSSVAAHRHPAPAPAFAADLRAQPHAEPDSSPPLDSRSLPLRV